MREELRARDGLRGKFTATFRRHGTKHGYRGKQQRTVLLVDVRDEAGKVVTDHLWFVECMGFKRLALSGGERLSFEARVKTYLKGYQGRNEERAEEAPVSEDYKLSWPNKIRLHRRVDEPPELELNP